MSLLILSILATFSIAAYDAETDEWGVGVASCVPFAYHSVAWAEAGLGAIATQSWTNHFYGPQGLELLQEGLSASEVVSVLTSADSLRENRQLGIVDMNGEAAALPAGSAWTGRFHPGSGLHHTGQHTHRSGGCGKHGKSLSGNRGSSLAHRIYAALLPVRQPGATPGAGNPPVSSWSRLKGVTAVPPTGSWSWW